MLLSSNVCRDDAHAIAYEGCCVVATWHGEPTEQRVDAMARAIATLGRMRSRGVVVLNVIGEETPLPDGPTRAALQRHFADARGRILALANVLTTTGVEGLLGRTMLTALSTAARRPFPTKVFANVEDAAWWISSFREAPPPSALVAAWRNIEAR